MANIKKRIEKLEQRVNPVGVFLCFEMQTRKDCLNNSSMNTCFKNSKGNIEYYKKGQRFYIDSENSKEVTSIIIDDIPKADL